ncbi:MAG: ion transporter [Barnesiella sp.]|nr:ion transporter [Barnesiella sp.]
MSSLKQVSTRLVASRAFDFFITLVIIVNSVLIGVQVTHDNSAITFVQHVILLIFTFEIFVRYIAAGNVRDFLNNGWNVFDLTLVIIGWIPADIVEGGSTMMALRVLRVFRVLRLLRTSQEIKLIVAVLMKSMRSMSYNALLFLIFVYLYAIIGVSMFRLPSPDTLSGEELTKYEQLMDVAPHSPANSPDPFGDIPEAVFTLFRALTGEDWTDLRYNLVTASNMGLVHVSPTVITIYHVSWFCIAAFLLLNLVTGAVINNYQVAIDEAEKSRHKSPNDPNNPNPTPNPTGPNPNPSPGNIL